MTNEQVAVAFVQGKFAQGSNFYSTGNRLYSYAYPLAWRRDDGSINVNQGKAGTTLYTQGRSRSRSYDAAFSPTTQRHRQHLWRALWDAGYQVKLNYPDVQMIVYPAPHQIYRGAA